ITLKDGNDPQQLKEFPIAVDGPLHSVMYMETASFVDQDLGKLLEQQQCPVNLGQAPETGKDGAHQFAAASPLNGVVQDEGPGLVSRFLGGEAVQDQVLLFKDLGQPPPIRGAVHDLVRWNYLTVAGGDGILQPKGLDLHPERPVGKVSQHGVLLLE